MIERGADPKARDQMEGTERMSSLEAVERSKNGKIRKSFLGRVEKEQLQYNATVDSTQLGRSTMLIRYMAGVGMLLRVE